MPLADSYPTVGVRHITGLFSGQELSGGHPKRTDKADALARVIREGTEIRKVGRF